MNRLKPLARIKVVEDGAVVVDTRTHHVVHSVEGLFVRMRARRWCRKNGYEPIG